MAIRLGSKEVVPPPPVWNGEEPAIIEQSLDLLLQGRYLSVPDGTGPLARKIKAVANFLHKCNQGHLQEVVGLSMAVSEAVTGSAGMMSTFPAGRASSYHRQWPTLR